MKISLLDDDLLYTVAAGNYYANNLAEFFGDTLYNTLVRQVIVGPSYGYVTPATSTHEALLETHFCISATEHPNSSFLNENKPTI